VSGRDYSWAGGSAPPVTASAVVAVTPVNPVVFVVFTLFTTFANVEVTPVIHSAAEARRGMATITAVALELASRAWRVVLPSMPSTLSPATAPLARSLWLRFFTYPPIPKAPQDRGTMH
jgi:hypothetical protein